jgi:hypothetical protein
MSKLAIILGAVVIIALIFVSVGLAAANTYNSAITARNSVDAAWRKVLSAYEENFVSVAQHAQVANFSVHAQINMTLMYAAIREGKGITTADADKMNHDVATLDTTAAMFFIAVRQEAVPKLDTTQLTELNAAIENTLRVVKHERDAFTDAVMVYNNIIQTIPGVWFNSWFSWGFKSLQGFTPKIEHPPEANINLGLP